MLPFSFWTAGINIKDIIKHTIDCRKFLTIIASFSEIYPIE